MTALRVLICEDSPADAELMIRALRAGGFEPAHQRVDTAAAMRAALDAQAWDVILSDYVMPGFGALPALALRQERAPDVPFIVVSGSVGEDTAVAAMQAGATDYLMKDRLLRLGPAVARALAEAAARRERRRLEEQLRHAQKMEAVGQLAAGVAHDFNNVLTAVLGSAELLLLDAPSGDAREEVEIIRDAATRAQDLIRQLLAFSAQQVLKPVVLDLNALVDNVLKMLRRLIGEDIALGAVLAPDLGRVQADPGQIEQVLVNLAVNARDAMPTGGRLTLTTANVEIDAPPPAAGAAGLIPPGRYVLLQVTDTGTGMDAATQARIFEPFFTTKARGRGTGLGLATVYGIVRQSEGFVAVDSAPGAGTTFRIYLPRVDAPLAAPAAAPQPGTATGSGTVLLVEDERLVRVLARKILEQAGYEVLVAEGGPQALELARGHAGTIDLLVTDVVMPEMSGRDLVRRLLQERPAVRVLYMSGYSDDAVAQHGVLDAGTSFIAKPFTPAKFTSKVRVVLAN